MCLDLLESSDTSILSPSNASLTSGMLLKLLKPAFSPDRSTVCLKEKETYACFVKDVRHVASGRRHPLSLSYILIFVTNRLSHLPMEKHSRRYRELNYRKIATFSELKVI